MTEKPVMDSRENLTAARIRRWLVIRLIRWANRGWEASFSAYNRRLYDGFPLWYDKFWGRLANRIDRIVRGLAHRLDPENRWTGAEMAEHGWWG